MHTWPLTSQAVKVWQLPTLPLCPSSFVIWEYFPPEGLKWEDGGCSHVTVTVNPVTANKKTKPRRLEAQTVTEAQQLPLFALCSLLMIQFHHHLYLSAHRWNKNNLDEWYMFIKWTHQNFMLTGNSKFTSNVQCELVNFCSISQS